MGYLILGAITVALVSWMLIVVVQELCARVTRLEKEKRTFGAPYQSIRKQGG